MLFVDEFCGIYIYIKFGADVTSQYVYNIVPDKDRRQYPVVILIKR